MKGLFVTGTDTGAGKTLVTCSLIAALTKRGLRVGVSKPIETGATVNDEGHLRGRDCVSLTDAGGKRQLPEEIVSYLFREPAAPLVAANDEHAHIEPDHLTADVRKISRLNEITIVEGAGGLMVPIAADYTYLELATELSLPVLVVVGSRLGCVNHALLTLAALQSHGLKVVGWVLNPTTDYDPFELAARTNRDLIGSFTTATDLGTLGFVKPDDRRDWTHMAELAEAKLDIDAILAASGSGAASVGR